MIDPYSIRDWVSVWISLVPSCDARFIQRMIDSNQHCKCESETAWQGLHARKNEIIITLSDTDYAWCELLNNLYNMFTVQIHFASMNRYGSHDRIIWRVATTCCCESFWFDWTRSTQVLIILTLLCIVGTYLKL